MWYKVPKRFGQGSNILWITPVVAGVVLILKLSGWLQPLEWWALDQLICLRPLEQPDDRIVIVEIRETDVRRWGHPLSDKTLAQLLTLIRQQQPVAIGLDLYRDLPVPQNGSEYASLVNVLETTPNLVAISKVIGTAQEPAVNAPPMMQASGQVAANDIPVDFDGKVRRGFLYLPDAQNNNVLALGFQLAVNYLTPLGYSLDVTPQDQLKIGKVIFPPFSGNDGGYVNAESGGYQVIVNYRGTVRQFQQVAMTDVMTNRIPKNLLRGRIVLIGSVAESLKDFFYSPYSNDVRDIRMAGRTPSQLPGVYFHANLTSQVISSVLDHRALIQVWTQPGEILWILVWTGLGTAISWWFRPGSRWRRSHFFSWQQRRFLLPIAAGGILASAYTAFLSGWWIPLIPPLLGLTGTAIAITGYIAHSAEKIRKTFGRYVTDDVVNNLLETPDGMRLGGERRTVSILMSDIRGFSAISERFDPETIVLFLNIYLEVMADIIAAYQGTIDEFIGDAILVIFGAPTRRDNDPERAVACALAMQLAMVDVNARIQSLGIPEVSMGIAINTGDVVAGNIGSTRRAKYGVVGSNVNLTGRIESFTEGGQVLISESTFTQVQELVKVDQVFPIQPKGFQGMINIYDVMGLAGSHNLYLPIKDRRLVALPQPLELQVYRLENKHVVGGAMPAQLTALSLHYAQLHLDEPLPVRSDLKLNVINLSVLNTAEISPQNPDIYVKVIKVGGVDPRSCLVAITEIPPDLTVILTNVLARVAPSTGAANTTGQWDCNV